MLLYMVLTVPLCFIIIGFTILAVLGIVKVICVIIASIKAPKGELFRYPLVIPFIQ
jgi:uncharacterized Tic20 family protein